MSTGGLLDRVTALEAKHLDLVETLQAVLQVVGPGEVQAKVAETRRGKMARLVAEAVKDGKLEKRKSVTEDCLVVGMQKNNAGQVIFPGRFQLVVKEMVEDAKSVLLGALPGSSWNLTDGSSIDVVEIYGPPTVKTDAPVPATPAKKVRKKKV